MTSTRLTTANSFEEIYRDGTYLEKNPTWQVEDSPWKAQQVHALLKRNNITPDTVCEVGCGVGEILVQLSKLMPQGVRFSGYEITPLAIELAQARATEQISFHLADLITEPTEPFDVVLCIDVIEHVEDYYGFLRGLHPKGTYTVFHIPLDLSVRSMMSSTRLLNRRASAGHVHYFTPQTALAALRDTGYTVIDHTIKIKGIDKPVKSASKRTWMTVAGRKVVGKLSRDASARIFGGGSMYVLTR